MIDKNWYKKGNILTFEHHGIIFLVNDSIILYWESPDSAEDGERESQTPHVVSGPDQSWLTGGLGESWQWPVWSSHTADLLAVITTNISAQP